MDLAFLFLYKNRTDLCVFFKKIHKLGYQCFRKNKTSDGRSIGRSIHDGPQENTNRLMDLPSEVVGCAC